MFPRHVPAGARTWTAASLVFLGVGCSDAELRESPASSWITEADYQFGTASEDGLILQQPLVRADPPRNRLLVLDPPGSHVSEWTPNGELGFVVGRAGDGPGEFTSPRDLFVETDGSFSVLEGNGSRFTYYSARGDLVESLQGPAGRIGYQGFRIALAWPGNDVHLGIPQLPLDVELGMRGDAPIALQPLLRVRVGEGREWRDPEPLLWLDMRNRVHVMQYDGDRTSYGVQPFGDADHVRFAPGRAVVMRTRGPPGTLELLEVDGEGDTLWHRNVQLVPSRLTEAVVERRVARYMEAMEGFYDHVPRQELRARYREGLYTPAYLPAADGPPVLSASGGVWIRTHEVSDTLRAYYVLERGDPNTELRRVLLPEWLRVSDATATHVWGVWRDAMDVPHVVGRRLASVPQTR